MKDQNTSTKVIRYTAIIAFSTFVKDVDAFFPNTKEINFQNTLSKTKKISNEHIFNPPTSLKLSMDTIASSLRPFGSWYCQEDDPIGQIYHE